MKLCLLFQVKFEHAVRVFVCVCVRVCVFVFTSVYLVAFSRQE